MIRPSGKSIVVQGHVSPDGRLDIRLPELADRDVQVTVRPTAPEPSPPITNMADCRRLIDDVAGILEDHPIERPPQPPLEERDYDW